MQFYNEFRIFMKEDLLQNILYLFIRKIYVSIAL